MNTWVLEAGLSVLLFCLMVPFAIVPLVSRVYNKYGYAAPAPTAMAVTAGLYACSLVAFTTFPLPDGPLECRSRSRYDYWQVELGYSFRAVARQLADHGLNALSSGTVLQVLFNIVFFVPLGFLLAFWGRVRLLPTLGLGLLTSLVVESTQGTALWGAYPCPYRVAELDDLVTNTTGAGLGWLLGAGLTLLWPYRRPERRADPGPPSLRRRIAAASFDLLTIYLAGGAAGVGVNAVLLATDRSLADGGLARGVASAAMAVVVFVVVPLSRRDRATAGQACVNLALADAGSSADPADVAVSSHQPARASAVVARAVLRWLPVTASFVAPVFLLVVAVDILVIAIRRDRRSVGSLVGGARVVTRESLFAVSGSARPPGQPPSPAPAGAGRR